MTDILRLVCSSYVESNSTENLVFDSAPVFIVISLIQTLIIIVLGIILTVICYLSWKRESQKVILAPKETKVEGDYVEMQPAQPNDITDSHSNYTYIDEARLGITPASYPAHEYSQVGGTQGERESNYVNISDTN